MRHFRLHLKFANRNFKLDISSRNFLIPVSTATEQDLSRDILFVVLLQAIKSFPHKNSSDNLMPISSRGLTLTTSKLG